MRLNAPHHSVFRYGLVIVSVAFAMGLTRLLRTLSDFGISPLFFAAVLLSAWYGGFGPSLLATALSGIATAALLLQEHDSGFSRVGEHLLRAGTFCAVAVLVSSLHVVMKRAAEALRKAKEEAEAASNTKTRFLAMVSHELRTPLSPILMLADMLENDPALPPHMLQDVQSIRRSVNLEIRLIEDLVDLTRISAGKLRLNQERIDLVEPMRAALEICHEDIADKQLDIRTEFASGLSVMGDPVRLQQVFWNLIRNAIKFTPEGGQISARAFATANEEVVVEISDTGIGIDPARLSSIFAAFEQGEPDIQIRFGGLGLGLAICQALVEAHHGSVRAASEGKGHGATFSVALPKASPPAVETDEPGRQSVGVRV